jgi:hypothetical protein
VTANAVPLHRTLNNVVLTVRTELAKTDQKNSVLIALQIADTVPHDHPNAFHADMTEYSSEEKEQFFTVTTTKPIKKDTAAECGKLEEPSRTLYRRAPSLITNALVMALSGGMLMMLLVSSGGSVTMVGLGVVGVFASGIALFSLLMNFGTVYKQCTDTNDASEKCTPWMNANKAKFIASTAFKSVCAALALASALGTLGVIPLGHLLLILLPAFMIVSMIGALIMDKHIELGAFANVV